MCARARIPIRILVVDDDRREPSGLETTLQRADWLVAHAKSGDEAQKRVDREEFEAVLLEPDAFIALHEARRRAEEHSRAHDEFLAIASHELNTPLTALQLQLQRIERALGRGGDPAELSESLQVAQRSTRRLGELMQRLLAVSHLRGGNLELDPERFDLGALVREVAARLSAEAAQVGSRIDVTALAPVEGLWDRSCLEQVAINLMSNAIKYGRGRPIEVQVEGTDDEGIFRVRDLGIGIDPNERRRIFECFTRAVSERHFGGLGLGLYIVGQIVEAHDGRIEVESVPGDGATFTIALPRKTR